MEATHRNKPVSISSLTIVFPAFNDAGTIPSMVLTALMAARKLTEDYEIIVVNDASTDHTAAILDEMTKHFQCLRVIHHPHNRGYGSTLRTGFSAAVKEWVFYTDGDAQYNPLELVDLAAALQEGVDVVNGYKISRHDPLLRRIIGRVYHLLVKWAFGFHLRDVDCDFRLMRRQIFDQVELESKTGTFPLELVKKFQDMGYKFVEVPVHHYFRQYGKSQFLNWRRLFATGKHLLSLWWKLVIRKDHLKNER
jgi:glycosyltransferase involved in cell wall biosynthesis